MNLAALSSAPQSLPATTLAERVFDFVLLPGDRFSESELANQVQVSRTPLRQALQRLQREGFLLVFPKSGWQVAPLDFEAFDQLYDLRVLLETHAVARLCELEERPALEGLAEVWLIKPSERQAVAMAVDRLDTEMMRVHDDITERIRIIRRLDFTKPNRVEATYEEHARILRAITRRRSDEAQRLLRAHVEQSKLEVRHITLDTLYQARQRMQRG